MNAPSNGGAPAANYKLKPSELIEVLTSLVEIGQPCMVWGPPGIGKSDIARQVADTTKREYVDIRALLLDPVDLRGIPWRDESTGQTRWAPPVFLPREDSAGRYLVNLEELPSAVPMVQAALYQLVLDRKVGEYSLPDGASLIACGNRLSDRAVVHNMSTALASRFVHVEVDVDVPDWSEWASTHGVAPEVIFFIHFRPDLLHAFDPSSKEHAFPCPRTWSFVSSVLLGQRPITPEAERAIFAGAVGEGAAVEFSSFLRSWRQLPHPRTIIDDPDGAKIPSDPSALIACCGSLYRQADDTTFPAIAKYAERIADGDHARPEVGEFLVSSCIKQSPDLQYTADYIKWVSRND